MSLVMLHSATPASTLFVTLAGRHFEAERPWLSCRLINQNTLEVYSNIKKKKKKHIGIVDSCLFKNGIRHSGHEFSKG